MASNDARPVDAPAAANGVAPEHSEPGSEFSHELNEAIAERQSGKTPKARAQIETEIRVV